MATTNWQREDVTLHYLQHVRGGIPFGAEQVQTMLQVIEHFTNDVETIIDLGCGNGFLGHVLLQAYPHAHATLLDHSLPMVEQAKRAVADVANRCTVLHGDFSEQLTAIAEPNSVSVIVSGFAIHHLPDAQKKQLYADIYTLLRPGGIFINVEHTASASPALEALYDKQFVAHVAAYNERPIEDVAAEYAVRPDKDDNILQRVDIQVDWLRDIGFTHADCYFKWFELAVFGGVKG